MQCNVGWIYLLGCQLVRAEHVGQLRQWWLRNKQIHYELLYFCHGWSWPHDQSTRASSRDWRLAPGNVPLGSGEAASQLRMWCRCRPVVVLDVITFTDLSICYIFVYLFFYFISPSSPCYSQPFDAYTYLDLNIFQTKKQLKLSLSFAILGHWTVW